MIENNIKTELRGAGDRQGILAADQQVMSNQARKKNYAQNLSTRLAQKIADALRRRFPEVLPDATGRRHESKTGGKGRKRIKLDVNYSTAELGLALAVSIKTINFRDPGSKRYTKNYTRADKELRAEAQDCHHRHPHAVMAALVFLPIDACDDQKATESSFAQAVRIFRGRAGRRRPTSETESHFEAVYIGLYEPEGQNEGNVIFFNVDHEPPPGRRPPETLTFEQVLDDVVRLYDERNAR